MCGFINKRPLSGGIYEINTAREGSNEILHVLFFPY